jgi:uncharacterized protein (UPF0276 family)
VSSRNHGFAPEDFIAGIPRDRVGQFHLAGHEDHGAYVLDTHDHPVPDPVWALYASAVARFGRVSTLVEWDDLVPALDVLLAECAKARAIEAKVLRVAVGMEHESVAMQHELGGVSPASAAMAGAATAASGTPRAKAVAR